MLKPPFRIVVKARRWGWLPPIWPNVTWWSFESPPEATWQEAYDLALQARDAGALFVQIQSLAEKAA